MIDHDKPAHYTIVESGPGGSVKRAWCPRTRQTSALFSTRRKARRCSSCHERVVFERIGLDDLTERVFALVDAAERSAAIAAQADPSSRAELAAQFQAFAQLCNELAARSEGAA